MSNPNDKDALYLCLCCHCPISDDPELAESGISLDDSEEQHVCRECWDLLSPLDRIEQCRKWRLDRSVSWVCDELARICNAENSIPFQFPKPGNN